MDIFCKIIKNEIPSYTLYEDEIVKVFLDANPNHTGHTLIIPKKHYENFYDIDEKTLHYILKIAKNICNLLKEKLNCDGITLCQNNELGQEIKHYHLHLIPRYHNEEKLPLEEVYNKLFKDQPIPTTDYSLQKSST